MTVVTMLFVNFVEPNRNMTNIINRSFYSYAFTGFQNVFSFSFMAFLDGLTGSHASARVRASRVAIETKSAATPDHRHLKEPVDVTRDEYCMNT